MKNHAELHAIARRYRDGEEMEKLGGNALIRFRGLSDKLDAVRDAKRAGYTRDELHDMVAEIDIEEEDVQ